MIKFKPGLIAGNLGEIETSTWYRQRFDACPHFMFFLGDAHISTIQKTKYPFGQKIAYTGFSKNRADWYHCLGELENTTSLIIKASRKDPRISKKMIADFDHWQKDFYQLCKKIAGTDLRKLGKAGLLSLYNKLADVYTKKLNSSPLIDGFALSSDRIIALKIKNFLEAKQLGEKFVEFFGILTAPVFKSFLQEEEIALLKAAKKAKANPKNKTEILKKHQQEYFWIQNNYVKDHVLDFEYFKKRLEAFLKINIDKKIKEIESIPKNQAKEKLKLIRHLKLDREIVNLINITDDFNWWQDERKKGTFWATHYFSMLLKEFVRRTKYSLEQLKYAFPPEMGKILDEKIDPEELDRRFNYCIILWKKNVYDFTTDLKLIDKLDRIGTGAYGAKTELKGFVASKGYARGKVVVLESVEETGKVKDGDVIVAVMTRPDYLPAMKKAAAFVTDEGGITCHAAIVAREMKKPCIIGTKVATKVLKDGDMVEVDANSGVVKLIK